MVQSLEPGTTVQASTPKLQPTQTIKQKPKNQSKPNQSQQTSAKQNGPPQVQTTSTQQPQPRSGRNQRGNNKRDSEQKSKPSTPVTIMQRQHVNAQSSQAPDGATQDNQRPLSNTAKLVEPVEPTSITSGYTPISREEGIAAGNAILGMLGQSQPPLPGSNAPQSHEQTRSRPNSMQSQPPLPQQVNKEQLKQTLITLLDEPQFFDQIYHAYVSRMRRAR